MHNWYCRRLQHAHHLARFFGTLEGFCAGLQLDYETARAREVMTPALAEIAPWKIAA